MIFTKILPTAPGFYAWRKDAGAPISAITVTTNEEMWRAGAVKLQECYLNKGEWCRLVPAEEIDLAYEEGWDQRNSYSFVDENTAWNNSRAKRVMDGKE